MLELKPNHYYHVYNHGNAEDNIFRNENNYHYFLKKYSEYIHPVADTYAYCLMPNHFHLLIKVREQKELLEYFKLKNPNLDTSTLTSTLAGFQTLLGLVSKQFSHFLNGYTQAFNKQHERKGKLFLQSLQSKEVIHDKYFTTLIHYIHANPVHHGFVDKIEDWPYSSYEACMSEKNTRLKREEVMQWFGSRANFYTFHQKPIDEKIKLEMEF